MSRTARIAFLRCQDCACEWPTLSADSYSCPKCRSARLDEPVFILKVREELAGLEEARSAESIDADEYQARKGLLLDTYEHVAPIVFQRARQVYDIASRELLDGDTGDDVLDRLARAMLMFLELGASEAAGGIARIIPLALLERGRAKAVSSKDDLADLLTAEEWFGALDEKPWQASTAVLISQKALHPARIPSNQRYQELLDTASWKLHSATDIYMSIDETAVADRLERQLSVVEQRFVAVTQAAGQENAAATRAEADIVHGELVRDGLVTQGRLQREGMIAQGQVVAGGLEVAGSRVREGLMSVATGIDSAGSSVSYGLQKLGTSVQRGLETSGASVAKAFGGLGTKLLFGMLGGSLIQGGLIGGAISTVGRLVGGALDSNAAALGSLAAPIESFGQQPGFVSASTDAIPHQVLPGEVLDASASVPEGLSGPTVSSLTSAAIETPMPNTDGQFAVALSQIGLGGASAAGGNPLGYISALQGVDKAVRLLPSDMQRYADPNEIAAMLDSLG